jgi:hypothetical protein
MPGIVGLVIFSLGKIARTSRIGNKILQRALFQNAYLLLSILQTASANLQQLGTTPVS